MGNSSVLGRNHEKNNLTFKVKEKEIIFFVTIQVSFSLKGKNKKAQGIALGWNPPNGEALKGRHKKTF